MSAGPWKELEGLRNSRAVWRCSLDGQKLELYQAGSDAVQWLLDNKGIKCQWKNISRVCQNKRNSAYGFKWMYDIIEENIFEDEIWKELEGFSKYKFSNTGKVWSKKLRREKSLRTKLGGYVRINLYTDEGCNQSMLVHRLIALAFIANPENKKTVNHKNHNRADNRVENLEWATASEQNNHQRKPSKEVYSSIRARGVWRCSIDGEKLEYYETITNGAEWIAKNKGIDIKNGTGCISMVCQNKRNTAYGFKWIYDTSDENIFENEIWKDIPKELVKGSSNYKISDKGRIKNPKGRILKGYVNNGYKIVGIGCKRGKSYRVHRLVAQVFLPNFYNKPLVNHKDHNKANCKLYNLEWVTSIENMIAAVNHYSSKKD